LGGGAAGGPAAGLGAGGAGAGGGPAGPAGRGGGGAVRGARGGRRPGLGGRRPRPAGPGTYDRGGVVTPMPGWRGRLRALRSSRLVVAASAVAAAAVALIVIGATVGSGASAPQNLGPAKNFTLGVLGHPARQLSLQSMAGHPVIVNFFASWCGPCQQETPLIARFYRARQGHVAIIGVDVNDSAAKAVAFVRKSGVTYPVAVDPMPMRTAVAY